MRITHLELFFTKTNNLKTFKFYFIILFLFKPIFLECVKNDKEIFAEIVY